jgi:hypothetical protein
LLEDYIRKLEKNIKVSDEKYKNSYLTGSVAVFCANNQNNKNMNEVPVSISKAWREN